MKILIVAENLGKRSGWGRISADIADTLAAEGHEVVALVQETRARSPLKEIAGLPPAMAMVRNPLTQWRASRTLRKALRETRPDLVHFTVEPYANCVSYFLGQTCPMVLSVHGTFASLPLKRGGLSRWLALRYYGKLDYITCLSRFTQQDLYAVLPSPLRKAVEEKSSVVNGGIQLQDFVAPPAREAALPKRVLFVGEVKPRKGVHELIDACQKFRERYDVPFLVDIIGPCDRKSEYVRELQRRVTAYGLESRITLHGLVSEEALLAAYGQADLFVMLSKADGFTFEGYGLVYLEASALGIPVIGSTVGGCPDAIHSGKSGYVCDPENATDVAEKMAEVLISHRIRREECLAWAEAHSMGTVIKDFERCYERARLKPSQRETRFLVQNS